MVGGKGKKKIEITRIVDRPRRSVAFSKRRKGLFKKAAELDVLCGSDTAIISVSEAGTIFAAGRPSLVHGLLLGSGAAGGGRGVELDYTRLERMGWDELASELAALNKSQLEIEELLMVSRNAAASVTSQKAHVFVDAAAAATATAPPPAFPTHSLSGLEDETSLLPLTSGDCSGVAGGDYEDGIVDFLEDEELIAPLPTLLPSGLEEDGLLPLPSGGCSGVVVGDYEDGIFDFLEDEELIALPTLLPPGLEDGLLLPSGGGSGVVVGDSEDGIFDFLEDEELIGALPILSELDDDQTTCLPPPPPSGCSRVVIM